jgi:hypothetical protein
LFSSVGFGICLAEKFCEMATTLAAQSDSYLKPASQAIMQTFLLFLALSDPSPRALMIMGAVSLGSLAIFLRHKLG